MDSLRSDLRFALRSLRQRPGFTAVAILTLALGIGAVTAIFSVVNGVLLRPLPYVSPERLMMVHARWEDAPRGPLSIPEYWDLREQVRSFAGLAAYSNGSLILTGSGEPERLQAGFLTADALSVLGVSPARGRGFAREEDLPGGAPVVLMGDRLWRRRFGADPGIVGRTLLLDDVPTTVVGVMPPGFQLPSHHAGPGMEIWAPLQLDPAIDRSERGWHWLEVFGRLRPEAGPETGDREIAGLMADMGRRYPAEYSSEMGGLAAPVAEELVGGIRPVILVLLGAVALLLLIACANVAGLLLARADARQREIAVRAALGARAGRIVRQLLTESVVLALAGGLLGVLLALWGVRALVAAAPPTFPRLEAIGVDGWVLGFAALLTLGTGLLFGIAPALHAAAPDLSGALSEGGRAGTAGGARQRFRRALVVGQVALALVLLIGAGLLIRSFVRLQGVDPGFDPGNLLTARMELSPVRYETNAQIRDMYVRLVERLEILPGVRSAAVVKALPMTQLELGDWSFLREGQYSLPPRPTDWNLSYWQSISPGYLATMRIPVLQGRGLEPGDRLGSPGVVLINRTLAQQTWPEGNALGQRILLGGGSTDSVWRTVVGVVGDVRHRGLDRVPRPEIYLPYAQFPAGTGTVQRTARLVVRTEGDPLRLAGAVRSAVAELDADLPLAEVQTMEQALGAWAAERRLTMLLVGSFALLALVLGAVGVYGVVAHLVVQRTREIGIRIALGARPGEILRLVISQGAWLAGLGIAAGVLGAVALTRLLAGLLFQVNPTDPITFAGTALVLAVVAGIASAVPAIRATRVDPTEALRAE